MISIGQHNDMKNDKSACLCGLNWSNGSNAGVFSMNLNNARNNSNDNVGGRDCNFKPDTTKVETGIRGVCCPGITEINLKEFQ